MNSNINIRSNIYIRHKELELKKDTEYLSKITSAEKLNQLAKRYFGLDAIPFSEIQENIRKNAQLCINVKNGEQSYGTVRVGKDQVWSCRCEKRECSRFSSCMSAPFAKELIRTELPEEEPEIKEDLGIFLRLYVGIEDISEDDIDYRHSETEKSEEDHEELEEIPVRELLEENCKFTKLTEPDRIIEAPLETHILLNSGPGTGKTYTIIRRLIYLLSHQLCPAETICILCYTRSAVKVIEEKLEEAITNGTIPPSANNICVTTFDSYATYFLMNLKEQDVLKEDFSNYGYQERIELFNKNISEEDLEPIQYFIVDEIQDLVNERAQMVLQLLHCLHCGYLLAGDRCQSIYDFEADRDAKMDSVQFYQRAEEQFPEDLQRYEIVGNRRQSPELAAESEKMRQNLLTEASFEQKNQYANEIIEQYLENIKIETYIQNLQEPSASTAILCRSNGEAEYVSGLLCKRGIRHTLHRGVQQKIPLSRWIADVFWDYCEESISRTAFLERFAFRSQSHSQLDPVYLWEQLCEMTDAVESAPELSTQKLFAALANKDIPNGFYEAAPRLTVSTIHKAKGSEFDRVILLKPSDGKPSSESAEEARIRYVAMTRPKKQLVVMKKKGKPYFKRIDSGRAIMLGWHNNKIKGRDYKYCKNIVVGFQGDVEPYSFVQGSFDTSITLQEYILSQVSLYDALTAERDAVTGKYRLLHHGTCVGMFSEQMTTEIEQGIQKADYKFHLPDQLKDLYVSGITTELLKQNRKNIPLEFQKSKICYGIQITGFARLEFERGN